MYIRYTLSLLNDIIYLFKIYMHVCLFVICSYYIYVYMCMRMFFLCTYMYKFMGFEFFFFSLAMMLWDNHMRMGYPEASVLQGKYFVSNLLSHFLPVYGFFFFYMYICIYFIFARWKISCLWLLCMIICVNYFQ